MKRVLSVAAALLLLAGVTVWGWSRGDPGFPHEKHAQLFPLCESCHAGITDAQNTELYPKAESCASCHDGTRLERIEWAGPKRAASNLDFSHAKHRERLGQRAANVSCNACHGVKGDTAWMAVARATPDNCLSCHARGAGPRQHLALETSCRSCHVPVATATTLTSAQIAGFPQPASHEAPDFISRHAPANARAAQNCSVCHAVESCARCHANVQRLPAVAALQSDPRFLELLRDKEPVYPVPASHTDPYFTQTHGKDANKSIASCANCHTRPSCITCHANGGAADRIAQLPDAGSGLARGVLVAGFRRIHPIDFSLSHGISAEGDGASCSGCHQVKFCTDCHRGSESRRFHPLNYAARHGPDSYASRSDCASCHNRQVFCQSCHTGLGLASASNDRPGSFHNRQPIWLLQHGQAARQNLEGCTSCHTQPSCLRCHSAKGGWNVSPHGPGFNAERERAKNPITCNRCHFSKPK